jgi:ATP-binding protein involved in chromosome partitioning
VGIPILGVVENESFFVCDGCSARHEIFGSGGGQKVADFADAPLLGQIPMDPKVREWGDAGTPVVQASPGSDVSKVIVEIAERVLARVEAQEQEGPVPIDRSGGVNRRLPVTR